MRCPVCHRQATSLNRTIHYHRISCPRCGEFKISDALEMALSECALDTEPSQHRLAVLRETATVPTLTAYDSDLLIPR